jgi:hypothetical protein
MEDNSFAGLALWLFLLIVPMIGAALTIPSRRM